MDLEKLRAEAQEILKKMDQRKANHLAAGTEPSADERAEVRTMIDRYEEIEDIIKTEERAAALSDRTAEIQAPVTQETTEETETRRAEAREVDNRFGSLGEMLIAVARAEMPGAMVDRRLVEARAVTGLGEGVPSDGGFLVGTDMSQELLSNAFDTGLLSSRARRITVSSGSNSIKINGIDETSRAAGSRWGGIVAYWTAEAGEKTASKPKFRQIQLDLNKLICLCYATDEVLADAGALESIIRQGFANEIGFMLDDAMINGSGAGQPLGILNAGCIVSVGAEAGQAATTLVYENIVNMWARLLARSRPTSVWLINQDCEPQLHTMSLAVGTGGVPVYLPAGGASASPYATLYGRPVLPIEQCQTLGTTGDIYLADFANGYILAEKGGVSTDVSIHVRFIYDESVYRFVVRVDGQPVLASAITPAHGTNTQSHFIKLDART